MTNSTTKISVIIPCYKKAHLLSQTLDSVLQSDFSAYEIIVVNDGSPDNTDEIIKKYQKKYPQINYIFQENLGVCVARNNGITHATGKYILPLDADDLIGKSYLRLAVESFEKNPNLVVVYSKAAKFKKNISFASHWFLGRYSFINFLGMCLIPPACVFKKSDFEKMGGYDVQMKDGIEDWEFLLNLLITHNSYQNTEIKQLDYVGYYYRIDQKDSRHAQFNAKIGSQEKMMNHIYTKHQEIYKKYYGEMRIDVISDLSYYKFKMDRLEYYLKFATIENPIFSKIKNLF
jgi:glycosyltransferase involved in cell wall biosynthesis